MQRKYNLTHFLLASVLVLGLTSLMVAIDAQARIAFMSDRDGRRDIRGWLTSEIYVMDADGGNQQRLTENRVHEWAPSWSPNSKRIAFVTTRTGKAQIYVMDADGGNPQDLSNNRHRDFSPAWLNSPFSVAPAGKILTMWRQLKQVD